MKLLPDRLGQFKAVFVVEGHIHVGGLESALTASQGSRLGDPGQVHEIKRLVHGKRHGTEAADTIEPQFPSEMRPQPKAVTLQAIDPAVQPETAHDLELRFRESEDLPRTGDGDAGTVRRHRGQVDAQGGGIVGCGQGRRILPSGRVPAGRAGGGTDGPHRVESPAMRGSALPWILFAVPVSVGACNPPPAVEEPEVRPWEWTEAEWRAPIEAVRAGRRLAPSEWPGGNRVAVALSFDFDNETVSLRDNNTSASVLSRGQYGSRAGLPRVLDLLRRHEIPASFFIPAVSALIYQEDVAEIVADGHEIGVHGWIHERNSLISGDVERELIERAIDTLTELTGTRPVGLRTPSWDYSPNTLQIVRDLGFLYDSSLMADDWPYEIVANGEPTGVVELPVEWILDDAPYFGFSRYSALRPHSTPDDVLSIWKAEFDMAHAEGGMFLLTMHPHVIGHRSRIAMLERLIQHMDAAGDVWYATHEEVARYALENAGGPD